MNPGKIIGTVLLFAVGLSAGWLLRPSQSSPSSSASEPTPSSRVLTSRSGSPSPHALMRSIRQAGDESQRHKLTIELASNLLIGQISAWLDDERFTQREGFSIVLFSKLLEQRLLQERPGLFLERKLSKGHRLSREEMAHFGGEHLARYLEQLESLENPEKRGAAIRSLAMIRPDLALAELLKLNPQKLHASGDLPGVLRQIALSDLSLLEASLDDLPLSAREVARGAVFEVRLNEDFPGTLSELLQLPDGLDILRSSQNLSKQSRRLLLEKFSTLPENWRSKIGERLYLLRGDMKPHEVLETDWTSFGLTPKQAGEITGYALFSQVRSHKENAADLFAEAALEKDGAQRFLDLLRMNGGRETIKELLPHLNARDRRYIVSKMGGEEKINNPVSTPTTATELVAHLTTTDPEHDHRTAWNLRKWTPEQKEQFQKDYAAMQGEDRDRLTVMLAKSEEAELQTDAVVELLGNDRLQEMAGWDEDRVERTISEVAVGLLKTDSGRAAQWVRALPKGSARSWAIKNLYRNWRNYELDRAEEFLRSFPPEDRR